MDCEENTYRKMILPTQFKRKKVRNNIKSEKSMKHLIVGKKLFSKFSEGVILNKEAWFSVTPELIAKRQAKRCLEHKQTCFILDPFCGFGGNIIQFALARPDVFILAIDNNEENMNLCKHNAQVYGVSHRIEFVLGDYKSVMKTFQMKPDVIFLSPPWSGINYKEHENFKLEYMGIDGGLVYNLARKLTENIAYFLPRNICEKDLIQKTEKQFELEESSLNGAPYILTAYYGNLINKELLKEEDDHENA